MGSPTRKERYPASSNEKMMPFRLQGLLEPDHVLIFNPQLGTLSHLTPGPELLQEQQFTVSELYLLIPLLQNYPHYCPYEILLASFERGQPTLRDIDRYRLQLQTAQQQNRWEECIRPMRGTLSRARLKMRNFGIDVAAVTETGYMLKHFTRVSLASSEMAVKLERLHTLV